MLRLLFDASQPPIYDVDVIASMAQPIKPKPLNTVCIYVYI